MNKALWVIGTAMELACIAGLAAIGLKRNKDAYNAEVECIKLKTKLMMEEIDGIIKNAEIEKLKKELEELKQH